MTGSWGLDRAERVTLSTVREMKRTGKKVVGVVAWDFHIASVAERIGADLIVVGDSVGVNMWGHRTPLEVTLDEMVLVAKAVRRGVKRALLCVDLPFGLVQVGERSAVSGAIRLVKEAGADMIKVDAAADYADTVAAVARAGIPVFAQFGMTPHRCLQLGIEYAELARLGDSPVMAAMSGELVTQARRLEAAGAALLDFTNSGPVAGPAVVAAVGIPVLGGFGGGPWLDGRVRMATAAIGYAVENLDHPADTYANVAQVAAEALTAYSHDVRSGRQIRGGVPLP